MTLVGPKQVLSLAALLSPLLAAVASPVVIDGGPVFGAPIDISNTSAGSLINGGNTRTYTHAAASPVANVYFGLYATALGASGFSGNGPGLSGAEVFAWHANTGNSIEYRGQTVVPLATGGGQTVHTRLVMTAISGADVVSDATTQGLAGAHSLFHLTGGDFVIKRELELSFDQLNWSDAQPFYNGISMKLAGNSFQTDVYTGFYWENQRQDVPEPGSLALLGAALLAGTGQRRKTPRPTGS